MPFEASDEPLVEHPPSSLDDALFVPASLVPPLLDDVLPPPSVGVVVDPPSPPVPPVFGQTSALPSL